ncbi:MAG: hypothetical protein M3Y82_06150 [Verrucomicrobiota bacterium]|nr:hypothetical protein [Verrucomicrobiota bacterium]
MKISEPMTLFTDYALALLTLFWGIRLLRLGEHDQQISKLLWGLGFLATASASLLGGAFHGFRLHLSDLFAVFLWKASVYFVGLASLFMLSAMVLICTKPSWRYWALGIVALKFLVFTIWMIGHSEFRFVIYDYALAMIVIFLLQIYVGVNHRAKSAAWIVGGVLIGLAGGAIQMKKISLHEYFNHNDLFHVMQMAAFYLFYRGGKWLEIFNSERKP